MKTTLIRIVYTFEFAGFLLWELVLANLRLARDVIGPSARLRPGIIGVPLDIRSDASTVILANLVTLTPGTLSLALSPDGKVLFVHAVRAEDAQALRAGIKHGFERRVRRFFHE